MLQKAEFSTWSIIPIIVEAVQLRKLEEMQMSISSTLLP